VQREGRAHMKNTDFKYLAINTKARWEEGDKKNLEVSDAGIALKKEPSHILEQKIGKSEGWIKCTDIAVDDCGVLYILDAEGHYIFTYEPVNKWTERLNCIGGEGSLPGQFKDPKGIALSPDTLYVADTGNNRIQAFARINWQIRWIVETTDSEGRPIPNGDSGEFNPVDIAVDDKTGNLYVLDSVNPRILKFDKGGRLKGTCVEEKLAEPVNIAIDKDGFLYVLGNKNWFSIGTEFEDDLNKGIISEKLRDKIETEGFSISENAMVTKEKKDKWVITDGEKIYIVKKEDGDINIYYYGTKKVLKFGAERKDNLVKPEFNLEELGIEPSGLAFDPEGNVYVGDKREIKREEEERFIHKFSPSGNYAGPLLGYRGLCYGMVMNEQGNFYVITGEEGEIALLKYISERYFIKEFIKEQGVSKISKGVFISKALDSNEPDCSWHKIVLDAEIPDKTQIDVHYYISDKKKTQNKILDLPEPEWTKLATFYASDLKLQDALVKERSGRYLWVKLELISSDEYKTPKIKSIRAYFPRISYLRYLPAAVYQEDEASIDFMERFLSLFETLLWDKEEEITEIARYFDVDATQGKFISWLATWVAAIFDESWQEEKRREFLRSAVELYKKRGTREGIEDLIEIYTGKKPIIVENLQLYEKDASGNFTLRCEENEEIKGTLEKLFGEPTPHSFCVLLKPGQEEIESQLKTIKRLIELEKPAHTNAGVVVLQPWIYLDMHTYLEINTYLSKPVMQLGITSVIGRDTVLTSIEGAGQIEKRSRTGIDTKLT
jgi:phage tail-like protein